MSQSDWNCAGCGHQAEDRPVTDGVTGQELDSEKVPYCANIACPHFGSIVPNYIHH